MFCVFCYSRSMIGKRKSTRSVRIAQNLSLNELPPFQELFFLSDSDSLCLSHLPQDDDYSDQEVSTVGVDFVSSQQRTHTMPWFLLLLCRLLLCPCSCVLALVSLLLCRLYCVRELVSASPPSHNTRHTHTQLYIYVQDCPGN